MKFTVNLKIVLATAVIVVFAMVFTTFIVQSRVADWFDADARSSLSIQSTLLLQQINDRNARLYDATRALSKRDTVISNVVLVDEILKEDPMSAFDVAYAEMNQMNAQTLELQARQNKLDAMFMVNSDGILTSFYSEVLNKSGWLTGEQKYAVKNLATEEVVEGVEAVSVYQEIEYNWDMFSQKPVESLSYTGFLSMKWFAPVVDQFDPENTAGYVVSISAYNQALAEELKALVDVDVNFYMNDVLAGGTYNRISSLAIEQLIGDMTDVESQGFAVRDYTQEESDYFSVLIPVIDGSVLDGALVVLTSKDWLFVRLQELGSMLSWLGLGVGLAGVLFVSLISRVITNPLKEMVKVIARIEHEGNFALRMHVKSNDEVGDGVTAINHLLTNVQENIDDINRTMSAVTNGDLTQRICSDAKGDLLVLKNSVNDSLDSLGGALRRINEGTTEVGGQTRSTSEAADNVAKGAEEQLESITMLSTAVGESTKAIAQVANHTEEASVKANESVLQVSQGYQLLHEMRGVINHISTNSQRIHAITDSIQGIAEQTNLLALNAAIEAARAGEQGRGFAVVADEVRNLASEASHFANEITGLAQDAVDSGEKAVSTSSQAEAAMEKLDLSSVQMKELLESISVAMEQQSMTLGAIGHNVTTLRDIGSENSQASQSINSSVSALSRVAQENAKQVNLFKL